MNKRFWNKRFWEILPTVRKPSRYLGGEKNAIRKDLSSVALRVVLCYPDTYEVGMSHLGLSTLYHLLNNRPEIACERVFAPAVDMEVKMREAGIPLGSLESGTPLKGFDILGITLPHELTSTNILTVLDLAKIPIYSRDRGVSDTNYPLILGGGVGAFNPEPVADFFDAILIGDGEEAILEICEVVKRREGVRGKGVRSSKTEILRELSKIRGVYVPSFFDVTYKEDGTIRQIKPLLEGYTGVSKRTVSDLDTASYPARPIVPHTRPIHDRLGIEVQRGCVRGCRFCQAGYIYRPERQRSPETVKKIVRNQIAATGQREVGLLSLSIGDYACLTPLLQDLMDEHAPQKVGISIPATRVEQLTPAMMKEIQRVRKTGFTIAPEAATDRMRNVINKGNSEENLLTTVRAVFSHGWDLVKFYFMIGLPTERDEDLLAIAALTKRALREALEQSRRAEINVSLSPFVPKPFTPFQWAGQISLEETRRRLNLLRSDLQSRAIRRLNLKSHRAEASYLEGIFSRGDRRLSTFLVAAWKKGCRFDEWGEQLRFDLWKEAWTETGIDPTFYVERERGRDEVLPWDHLFVEMDKEWLWNEYEAALRGETTEECSAGLCTQCGVCDFKEVRNRAYEMPANVGANPCVRPIREGGHAGPPLQYRCTFSKTGPAIFLSHLEFVDTVRRAVFRAGLPVRFSNGFHPQPKISFGPAMPVGREMRNQAFVLELEERRVARGELLDRPPEGGETKVFRRDRTRLIQEQLNRELPEGILIQEVTEEGSKSVAPLRPSPALSQTP